MQIPLQISFGNTDPSPAVEAIVRQKAAKLDRLFERIVSCDVTIEAPHRRQRRLPTPRCASSRIMRGGCEATSNRMRLRL